MFLKRAYDAVVDQNKDFAVALLASGYCILWHSIGIATICGIYFI
jgi:hypothetical protein